MSRFAAIRLAASWARAAYDSAPRYGVITSVDRRVGPFVRIGLEIHYGTEPPFAASTLSWPPRGVTPRVGAHVAVRLVTGDNHDSWQIEWGEPPHYGAHH
jgi:hypothetical protein